MEPILKRIKNDLKELKKAEKWKVKHINSSVQERLEYMDFFALNRKKHNLTLAIVFQKQAKSISVNYRVQYHGKNSDIDELYSFENEEQKHLPGISKADRETLLKIYQFKAEDNTIVNEVPLEKQYETMMKVLAKDIPAIIKYAKSFAKTKKDPE